jgi:hypothetical protein
MRSGLATNSRRRGRRSLGALFTFGAAAALLVGCGVTLSSGATTSEFFKRLKVTGDFTAGAELTLEVDYAQSYPVSLDVVCDLLGPGRPTPTPIPQPTPEGGSAGVPTATPTPVQIPKPQTTPTNRVITILDQTVAPNGSVPTVTQGAPFDEVTPVTDSLTGTFHAPEQPGRYIARCFTPADDNNQIRKTLDIQPAP